jgi:soluble lytic murein transglycosylase-like protein
MSGIDLSTYLNLMAMGNLMGGNSSTSLLGASSSAASFLPLLLSQWQSQSASDSSTGNIATYSSAQKDRLNQLQPYFEQAEQQTGVSKNLLQAVALVESGFDTNTTCGVMSLMPETQKAMGVTNVHDPAQNILAGAKILKQQLDQYDGNVELALAAYNVGGGAVSAAGGTVPAQARNYVDKVLSVMGTKDGTTAASYSDDAGTNTGLGTLDAKQLSSLLAMYQLQLQMQTTGSLGSFSDSGEDSASWL